MHVYFEFTDIMIGIQGKLVQNKISSNLYSQMYLASDKRYSIIYWRMIEIFNILRKV